MTVTPALFQERLRAYGRATRMLEHGPATAEALATFLAARRQLLAAIESVELSARRPAPATRYEVVGGEGSSRTEGSDDG